jgi:hypothetical protein
MCPRNLPAPIDDEVSRPIIPARQRVVRMSDGSQLTRLQDEVCRRIAERTAQGQPCTRALMAEIYQAIAGCADTSAYAKAAELDRMPKIISRIEQYRAVYGQSRESLIADQQQIYERIIQIVSLALDADAEYIQSVVGRNNEIQKYKNVIDNEQNSVQSMKSFPDSMEKIPDNVENKPEIDWKRSFLGSPDRLRAVADYMRQHQDLVLGPAKTTTSNTLILQGELEKGLINKAILALHSQADQQDPNKQTK